jgi:hypothetical protein
VISDAKFFATVFLGNSRVTCSDETLGAFPSSQPNERVSRTCAQQLLVRKIAAVKIRARRNMTRDQPRSNETMDRKQTKGPALPGR